MTEWNGEMSAFEPSSITLRGKLGCEGVVAGEELEGEVSAATWCFEAPDA